MARMRRYFANSGSSKQQVPAYSSASSGRLTNGYVSSETYQLAMYLLDQYRGTTLSCRYEIPPRLAATESRTQKEETVKVAVVDIIMRHPMLQVGMVDETYKTPSWIKLPSLDMKQNI